MRRNRPGVPARRPNPLRELIAEKQRASELTSSRFRVERLQQDLPAMISEQVGAHMERLESKLVEEFKELGQRAVEQSAAAITEQLAERIETLEQISAIQSKTLVNLKNTTKVAEQKVSRAVNSIERTLADNVPGGFALEPPPQGTPAMPSRIQFVQDVVKADTRELQEIDGEDVRYVFCPNCTSTKVRRAYRHGLWEEFLRLFFIAPFRCRACRHKFYRF